MRVADDYGDAGFGGHWAIEVADSEDGEFYGEYLGESAAKAVDAAACHAWPRSPGQPLVFRTKKAALAGMRAAKAVIAAEKERAK